VLEQGLREAEGKREEGNTLQEFSKTWENHGIDAMR
jgi:hypothetical protein